MLRQRRSPSFQSRISERLSGVNLIPFLGGSETGQPHDVLFWRLNQKTAVRVGDWKLLRNPGPAASIANGICTI